MGEVERNDPGFQRISRDYAQSVDRVDRAFRAYIGEERRTVGQLRNEVAEAAADYFGTSSALRGHVAQLGRDADGARTLLAMVGIDMLVMSEAASLAWYTGETGEHEADEPDDSAARRVFSEAERVDIESGLEQVPLLLAEIEGKSPPSVSGAMGSGQTSAQRTVAPEVGQIVGTTNHDLEEILKVGASAVLGAILSRAFDAWADKSLVNDALFKRKAMRWVIAKAIDAARETVKVLLEIGGVWITDRVTELCKRLRQVEGGLGRALPSVLDEQDVVARCNAKLIRMTDQEASSALSRVRTVATHHSQSRSWMPRATRGGHAVSFIPFLPFKRQLVLVGLLVLVYVSFWLAAAHVGPKWLPKFAEAGVLSVWSAV